MGQDLVEALIKYSGLPEDYARKRIQQLIEQSGKSTETLGLDDIREMASDLLHEVILTSQSKDQSA
jgi:hypothetical protein